MVNPPVSVRPYITTSFSDNVTYRVTSDRVETWWTVKQCDGTARIVLRLPYTEL